MTRPSPDLTPGALPMSSHDQQDVSAGQRGDGELREALKEIREAADELLNTLPGHWHDDATIRLTDATRDAETVLKAAEQDDLYEPPLASPIQQAPDQGGAGQVGPRTITTSRQTCAGCAALKLKEWKFCGENDEDDSGTDAKCGAASDKSISAYWSVLNSTPNWCPAIPATPKANTGEA